MRVVLKVPMLPALSQVEGQKTLPTWPSPMFQIAVPEYRYLDALPDGVFHTNLLDRT